MHPALIHIFIVLVLLLILALRLRSQQRDRVGEQYIPCFVLLLVGHKEVRQIGNPFLLVRVYLCSPCLYFYLLCLFSHSGAAADHSNGIEGGGRPLFCFVSSRDTKR